MKRAATGAGSKPIKGIETAKYANGQTVAGGA
jgi:hypothetical protein